MSTQNCPLKLIYIRDDDKEQNKDDDDDNNNDDDASVYVIQESNLRLNKTLGQNPIKTLF